MDTSQSQPYSRPFPSYTHCMHALCMVGPLDWTQYLTFAKFRALATRTCQLYFWAAPKCIENLRHTEVHNFDEIFFFNMLYFPNILWFRTSTFEGFRSRCMRLWECKNNIPSVIALCFLQGEWPLPPVVLVGIILL